MYVKAERLEITLCVYLVERIPIKIGIMKQISIEIIEK
jgi:hypothetical protein